jgi:hypothetical protein
VEVEFHVTIFKVTKSLKSNVLLTGRPGSQVTLLRPRLAGGAAGLHEYSDIHDPRRDGPEDRSEPCCDI